MALGTKMDVDKLRKKNRKSNWKFQKEQESFSVSNTWELMTTQKTWSFAQCWQWTEPHIGPVLRGFPDCWKQRVFLSCTGVLKFCNVTALIYTVCSIYFFKKKKLYVCVHMNVLPERILSPTHCSTPKLPRSPPHPPPPIPWNEEGEEWMGFGVFPLRKGHFLQPGQCSKG